MIGAERAAAAVKKLTTALEKYKFILLVLAAGLLLLLLPPSPGGGGQGNPPGAHMAHGGLRLLKKAGAFSAKGVRWDQSSTLPVVLSLMT